MDASKKIDSLDRHISGRIKTREEKLDTRYKDIRHTMNERNVAYNLEWYGEDIVTMERELYFFTNFKNILEAEAKRARKQLHDDGIEPPVDENVVEWLQDVTRKHIKGRTQELLNKRARMNSGMRGIVELAQHQALQNFIKELQIIDDLLSW